MKNPYEELLRLPHHVSAVHPKMAVSDRAAQFAPYATLRGLGDTLSESVRETEERTETDEDEKSRLNARLGILFKRAAENPEITVTFFRPDERKSGGKSIVVQGTLRRVDTYVRLLTMSDGTVIPFDDILELYGDIFSSLDDEAL